MGMENTQPFYTPENSEHSSENDLQSQERSERQKREMHMKITKELRLYSRRSQ